MVRNASLGILVLLAALAFTAPAVSAQDCGSSCSACGLAGYEGRNHAAGGAYNMDCHALIPYCVACPPPKVEMTAEHTFTAAKIIRELRVASGASIASLAARHGDRLLIVPERNLLVIKGTPCNADALASAVYIGSNTMNALVAAGVRSLADHLAAPTL